MFIFEDSLNRTPLGAPLSYPLAIPLETVFALTLSSVTARFHERWRQRLRLVPANARIQVRVRALNAIAHPGVSTAGASPWIVRSTQHDRIFVRHALTLRSVFAAKTSRQIGKAIQQRLPPRIPQDPRARQLHVILGCVLRGAKTTAMPGARASPSIAPPALGNVLLGHSPATSTAHTARSAVVLSATEAHRALKFEGLELPLS